MEFCSLCSISAVCCQCSIEATASAFGFLERSIFRSAEWWEKDFSWKHVAEKQIFNKLQYFADFHENILVIAWRHGMLWYVIVLIQSSRFEQNSQEKTISSSAWAQPSRFKFAFENCVNCVYSLGVSSCISNWSQDCARIHPLRRFRL